MRKETKEKRSYRPPKLKQHGGLHEMTRSEYGGLDKLLYGSIFSMSSPGLPSGPSR